MAFPKNFVQYFSEELCSNYQQVKLLAFRKRVIHVLLSFNKTHNELQYRPFANPQIKSSLYAFASTGNGNYSTFNDWKWYFFQRWQCTIIQYSLPDEKYSLIPHVPTYDPRNRPRSTADTLIYYIAIRKNCSHRNEMDWIVCSAANEAAHDVLAKRRHRCRTHTHRAITCIYIFIVFIIGCNDIQLTSSVATASHQPNPNVVHIHITITIK